MNQPQEKITDQIIAEGLLATQIETLKATIALFEKYPAEDVIKQLKIYLKQLEADLAGSNPIARGFDHE